MRNRTKHCLSISIVVLFSIAALASGSNYKSKFDSTINSNMTLEFQGNHWYMVKANNIAFDTAWIKLVNIISADYGFEILEKDSGYLKTEKKDRFVRFSYNAGGLKGQKKEYLYFSTQIVVRSTSNSPPIFEIIFNNYILDPSEKWPYLFFEDAEILNDIMTVFKKKDMVTLEQPKEKESTELELVLNANDDEDAESDNTEGKCKTNDDCPNNQYCNPWGECGSPCKSDVDCTEGYRCSSVGECWKQ